MNKWMDGWVDEHVIYPGGGGGQAGSDTAWAFRLLPVI